MSPEAAQIAYDGLKGVQAAFDAAAGTVEVTIPVLEQDALDFALGYVKSFVPPSVQDLINTLISTANAAAHSAPIQSLTNGQKAYFDFLKASVDSVLDRIENIYIKDGAKAE